MTSPEERDQELPAALAERVRAALERHAPPPAGGATAEEDAMRRLAAGEGLLAEALAGDERSRETALDLLAADALVTEAFEHLAAHPEALDARAAEAVRRIAALARSAPAERGPSTPGE